VRLVVLDTETTGLDPKTCGVVELAAVAVDYDPVTRTFAEVGEFETLVDPGHPIPPEASAVHHLVDADVRGAPDRGLAVSRVLDMFFSPDVRFVAHNSRFDKSHLPELVDVNWLCTMKGAREYLPDGKSGNQVLRYRLGLKPELPEGLFPHRALYDVRVTLEILKYLLLNHCTVEQLQAVTRQAQLLKTLPVGKHRDQKWSDVPLSYLQWMNSKGGWDEDVAFTLKSELEARGGRR
jgi:exodeoxyribonuclease X